MLQLLNDSIRSNFDFWDSYAFEKGKQNKGNQVMSFDWYGAAHMIKQVRPSIAKVGLQGDFAQTAKVIYQNKSIVINPYIRTSSTWAKPILVLDRAVYECFIIVGKDTWSNWTEETIKIVEGNKDEIFN